MRMRTQPRLSPDWYQIQTMEWNCQRHYMKRFDAHLKQEHLSSIYLKGGPVDGPRHCMSSILALKPTDTAIWLGSRPLKNEANEIATFRMCNQKSNYGHVSSSAHSALTKGECSTKLHMQHQKVRADYSEHLWYCSASFGSITSARGSRVRSDHGITLLRETEA